MKDRFAQAETLFHEVLELPPEEREAYLAGACGGDDGLRQEVAALVRASGVADQWLKDPPLGSPGSGGINEGPGTKLGHYRLRERIGEGGFGIVYMAEQEQPVRRQVALKIIKLGMDTRSVIARFDAERQALALMDHPNIAKVLDAGATDKGRPYFVMELVRGLPITKFCKEHQLNTREQLDLFIQVCGAIQHAHQKGIIHRDVKPTNVLVTLQDGVPHPKVIDFGVAKALNQRLTEETFFTRFAQMIGTPAYMSPEQAEMNQLDVDTRSDIYSLGVLLYELLTGTTPFPEERLCSAGYAEIQRIICEEEPEKPSTRIARRLESGPSAESKNRHRRRSEVDRDLDWIAMKCLEKDRTRRYATANGLAADLRRFLSSEPIVARPPSRLYRFQKLVRRNKLIFASAGTVAMALILGLGLSTWLFVRERASSKTADENARRAEQKAEESRRSLYAADMILAQAALDSGNTGHALDLLRKYIAEAGERDLRGWEWRHTWNRCRGDERFSLPSHAITVSSLALSTNGVLLATGGRDARVVLWDLANKQPLRTLLQTEQVHGLAFSKDEQELIVGTSDGQVQFWDCASWQPTGTLTNLSRVRALRVSPDGKLLAVSGMGRLTLWDLRDRHQIASIPLVWENYYFPAGLAFSPDSSTLAYSRGDGAIVLCQAANAQPIAELRGHEQGVTALAFSPDGVLLASASRDRTARVWDLSTQQERRQFGGFHSWIGAVAFSPDGTFLAVAGGGQRILLLETRSWKEINNLKGHTKDIYAAVFTPDGRSLLTSGKDGTVKCWDIPTLNEPASHVFPSDAREVIMLPGGDWVYVTHTNRLYSLWSIDPVEYRGSYAFPFRQTASIVSPDGRFWAGSTTNASVKILDHEHQEFVAELAFPGSSTARLAFSPDNTMLGAASNDRTCRVWKITAWSRFVSPGPERLKPMFEQIAEFPMGAPAYRSPRFSRSGRLVATMDTEGVAVVWDLALSRWVANLLDKGGVEDIAFTQDDSIAVTAGADGNVRVWNLATSREAAVLGGQLNTCFGVALSADDRRLAACGGDGMVKLWDMESKQEVANLRIHKYALTRAAFSADGDNLLVTAEDRLFVLRAPPVSEESPARPVEEPRVTAVTLLAEQAKSLANQGRLTEAAGTNLAAYGLPLRAPGTPATLVDLSRFYNESLEGRATWRLATGSEHSVQKGQQGLGPIEFDVRGMIRLASGHPDHVGLPFPRRVDAIAVSQKCRRLHFLHFAFGLERNGTPVASYVVHYSDGNKREIPVRYAEHLRTWVDRDSNARPGDSSSSVDWMGTNIAGARVRLFRTGWDNPRPDVAIDSIDFISHLTDSSPVLVAITAEP